jgi:valyl-tRNA synthetase
MDLRPQAHDIIRTWLFSTVLRSHLEASTAALPWRHTTISGFIVDPDRKKMSKSKGNVVTPLGLLQQYGSDGVRYFAARGGPGVDLTFDVGQMKIGRRLAIKLLNASKFVLACGEASGEVTEAVDRGMLTSLGVLVREVTAALEAFEYTRALDRTESFFWTFCDDYLELVKSRRYGDQGDAPAASANRAMQVALSTLLRLFAPFLPFVTEEAWSWWEQGSVHRAPWPSEAELAATTPPDAEALATLHFACEMLAEIRRQKSGAQRPMKAGIAHAVVRDTPERLARLRAAQADLCAAGGIQVLDIGHAEALELEVEFADVEPAGEAGA